MTSAGAKPIPIAILTPAGVQAAPFTASSFLEAAALEPRGVYTVGRTYDRVHVLLFDDHLDRLEQSARLEGVDVTLDRRMLRATLRDLIGQSGYAESRYKIVIPTADPEHIYLMVEPYQPVPADVQQNGAKVITVHLSRQNPGAKTSAWMLERQGTVASFPTGIYEGILVADDGTLLEGTSSNFYAVVDGRLRTAMEGVLEGISRRTLMKVAPDILPVDARPVTVREPLDEAFLTSAGRGVVPIAEIDGAPVGGTGKPGRFTVRLREAYNRWTEEHRELL